MHAHTHAHPQECSHARYTPDRAYAAVHKHAETPAQSKTLTHKRAGTREPSRTSAAQSRRAHQRAQTHSRTFAHAYTRTHTNTHTHALACLCRHTQLASTRACAPQCNTHTSIGTHAHSHAFTHTRAWTCLCKHKRTEAPTHAASAKVTDTHTFTGARADTCTRVRTREDTIARRHTRRHARSCVWQRARGRTQGPARAQGNTRPPVGTRTLRHAGRRRQARGQTRSGPDHRGDSRTRAHPPAPGARSPAVRCHPHARTYGRAHTSMQVHTATARATGTTPSGRPAGARACTQPHVTVGNRMPHSAVGARVQRAPRQLRDGGDGSVPAALETQTPRTARAVRARGASRLQRCSARRRPATHVALPHHTSEHAHRYAAALHRRVCARTRTRMPCTTSGHAPAPVVTHTYLRL